MILVGWILKKHPVMDMKSHNGYNTPASRKSQEHWDYAPVSYTHLDVYKRQGQDSHIIKGLMILNVC